MGILGKVHGSSFSDLFRTSLLKVHGLLFTTYFGGDEESYQLIILFSSVNK